MTDTIHAQGSGRVALAAAGLLTIASAAAPAWAGKTELVSVGPGGVEADGLSLNPSISGNGRFVAFLSYADNLVPGVTCCGGAVYVRDRLKGSTELVSVGPGGGPADGDLPSISGNGRFVAFLSFADDLVPGDTNGVHDVFVRDRKLGTTERVSVGPGGVQGDGESWFQSISADGRFVAFYS